MARNVREMLMDAGVPSFLTTIAIPFMWFIPGAVDPDSPSIIEINKGIQRILRKLGYRGIQVNGILDRETVLALDQISPPRGSWMQKTFVQIYGDLERAKKNPEAAANRVLALSGFGGYFEYQGAPPGPLPGFRAGTPPGPLGLGGVMDAGVELNFGPGKTQKSVMVAVPWKSGTTYNAFRRLQRNINRLLYAKSEFTKKSPGGRIGEDGSIGKETFKAFKRVQDAHFRQSFPGDMNTIGLASHAVTLANILEGKADSLGVSKNVNKGSTSTSTSLEQASAPLTQQQAAILAAQPPPSEIGEALMKYLPLLAIAGGVAWYAASQKKKGRKTKR